MATVDAEEPTWRQWTTFTPLLGALALAATWGRDLPTPLIAVVGCLLAGAVLAAVHHAEVVAHRVGEPLGSLLLAVAVTVIEVGLILTLMISGGDSAATLARDTVFAAVMITMNGILGLSLLAGSLRHHIVRFNAEGTGSALACVATVATLCLVLPRFTTAAPGPEFSGSQLAFAAVASLAVYVMFVSTQTVRHRDFFLPVPVGKVPDEDGDGHADPPSARAAAISLVLLIVALVTVVGLAKVVSPAIEDVIDGAGLPHSFVGVVIALMVLAPETLAAVRAAQLNRTQISLNLALGSAMASIGLTIPALAIASIWLPTPLHLGLESTHMILLALSVVVGVLTVVPGRATRLQGGVHLILLASFIFLAANP